MYQLVDVYDVNTLETKEEVSHVIGKDFDVQDVEVGKQARLNNISDSHFYHRVVKTSIIDNIIESFKEIKLLTKDNTMYILKKY